MGDEARILWRAEAAAAATGGALSGRDWSARGVEIDTRALQPGDLFVALGGAARDGHDFVADALAKGAAAALVSRRPDGLAADAPLLTVADDTLSGLQRLGGAARRRATAMKAAAVTGSVGKTSTKEMLARMLAPSGETHAAAKSFNNHIGVPLTLARTAPEAAFGVFEIGMNAPGEIAPLAALVAPNAALITAVEAVHLAAFDGIEGIADEKAAIFSGLAAGGVAVYPADGPVAERLARRAAAHGVGASLRFGAEAGEARLLEITREGEGAVVEAQILGARRRFRIGAPGRHFARNALGAALVVHALGADLTAALEALQEWRAVDGRGARQRLTLPQGGAIELIDESYNANPASLRAALAVFAETPAERRIAFVTDMLELGPTGPELHAEIASAPGLEALERVHTAGPLAAALHHALPATRRGEHHGDAHSLAARVGALIRAGDAVMVKGSNGSKAGAVAAAIRALAAR